MLIKLEIVVLEINWLECFFIVLINIFMFLFVVFFMNEINLLDF